MPIGSGLAAQVGIAKETTYGTRVAPTDFFEFRTEGFRREQNYLESQQLRAGRTYQSGSRRIRTTRSAPGSLSGEIPNKGFGRILDLLHGDTITPAIQGATTAYLQTHNLGTSDPGKSASVQIGKPDTGGNTGVGTVRPHDYLGCQVSTATFGVDVDEWLTFNIDVEGQDEDTAQTLATASYPTALEGFHFQQCSVTVNGVVQNLTTGSLVRSWSAEVGAPRATDRYGLRSNALRAKPITNAYTAGTGTMTFEYTDQTQYNLFTAGTKVPLVVDFTSGTLAGTGFPFRITFTFAQVQFTGSTPVVGGPDLLTFDAPYVILDNGTDPPVKIEYMSTTSAVL
jgi:hypothetical protein